MIRRALRRTALAFALALAACAAGDEVSIYEGSERFGPPVPGPRPEFAGYGEATGTQPLPWTAETLADDFIELTFETEWGARIDHLLRWERPVRVALIGAVFDPYRDYAKALIRRLDAATGAGLSVRIHQGEDAEIAVRAAPRAEMRAVAPGALCLLAPHRGDWAGYRRTLAAGGARWSGLRAFEALTVFIPTTAAPHQVRGCLEEELAQALGPGNDLWRLEDSVFNDDGAHLRATSFDLRMLRVLYDRELQPGMSRRDARRAAMRALHGEARKFGAERRLDGRDDRTLRVLRESAARETRLPEKLKWRRRIVARLRALGIDDHRLGEALARVAFASNLLGDADVAIAGYREAEAHFFTRFGARSVRLAITRGALGALLKREGRARDALAPLDAAIPVLAAHAAETHLAQAFRWRAAAHAQLGDMAKAKADARSALAWARYAFGARSPAVAAWRREFRDLQLTV